jgi:secreted PhoX family phosphatase
VVGPEFTPDETSLFLGLQHPGEGATSTFELPLTRWPDHNRKIPPRPSLLVIQQDANQPIGSV